MSKGRAGGPSLYLCCPDQQGLQDELGGLFEAAGFRPGPLRDCTHAVYIARHVDPEILQSWLDEVAEVSPEAKRWLTIPNLSKRRLRNLDEHVQLLRPRSMETVDIVCRIVGELHLLDRGALVGPMVGKSKAMAQLRKDLVRFGSVEEPVLVIGETGTGKELCAEFLHRKWGVGEKRAINCATLKPELVESELFGHVRGAFTGAEQGRPGLLKLAGKGTCFLDEIGEMALQAQASLLRVIEERKARPLGGNEVYEVQCRLVLATHRDLETQVAEGKFREDLMHRIGHICARIPPLRERMEDIPLLTSAFVMEYNRKHGTRIDLPDSFDTLFRYDWPGNVRELRGKLRSVMVGRLGGPLDLCSLEADLLQRRPHTRSPANAIPFYRGVDTWLQLSDRARKAFLEDALMRFGGINEKLLNFLACKKSKIYREIKYHKIVYK